MQGDSPPLPLHCVSRVTRMYRDDDWLEEEAESAACADDRCRFPGFVNHHYHITTG